MQGEHHFRCRSREFEGCTCWHMGLRISAVAIGTELRRMLTATPERRSE